MEMHACVLKSLQSCLTLCDPMDCSQPGSSNHGILQARILEWAALPTSRSSSWLRNQTHFLHLLYCGFFTTSTATWEAQDGDCGLVIWDVIDYYIYFRELLWGFIPSNWPVTDSTMHLFWSRKWQPTPVFLPGETHRKKSLAGYGSELQRVAHDWSDLACTHACIYLILLLLPHNLASKSPSCVPLIKWYKLFKPQF